jgi:hypothetical protein
MTVEYDAPQIADAGMAYSARVECSDLAWNDAEARAKQSLTPDDVLDEMSDSRYEVALRDAMASGDPTQLGAVFFSARNELVNRLALREVSP